MQFDVVHEIGQIRAEQVCSLTPSPCLLYDPSLYLALPLFYLPVSVLLPLPFVPCLLSLDSRVDHCVFQHLQSFSFADAMSTASDAMRDRTSISLVCLSANAGGDQTCRTEREGQDETAAKPC